jgi:hypothetical protein
MEDDRGKFFVFVAGYPENMDSFLKANPGLKSRFDKTLVFEDYSPEELYDIAQFMLKEKSLSTRGESAKLLKAYLQRLYETRDKFFGNARSVRKVVDELIRIHNIRLANHLEITGEVDTKTTITKGDLEQLFESKEKELFNPKTIGFRKS